MTDEALLQHFFSVHTEQIQDDGFTVRVMAATAQAHHPRLRRWSIGLNAAAAVGIIILLFSTNAFGLLFTTMENAARRGITWLLSFDADTLLVQAILFLHHLPDHLPTPMQLLSLMLATLVLITLSLAPRRIQLR